MNCPKIWKYLQQSIVRKVNSANKAGIVYGLSGGIDSATAMVLSVEALGTDNVHGLMLPYYDNQHVQHAQLLAETFLKPTNTQLYSIRNIANMLSISGFGKSDTANGNILARLRMIILYDYAYEHNLLVGGTCNRSETEVGYETKFGDAACDVNSLGYLYKTDLYRLVHWYNDNHTPKIPEVIMTKKPSADLYVGQTDEEELGMNYAQLDEALKYIYGELQHPANVNTALISKVQHMMALAEHKKCMPFIPQIPETWLLENDSNNGTAVSLTEFKQMVAQYSQTFDADQFKAFIETLVPLVEA